jgi:CMP-N-acetylneuraminic acid synthetase
MAICIIPARGGSKRIKNKNIKTINKIPVLGIVIKIAIKSKLFKRIIVSTDSEKIAKIAIMYGAEVPFLRNKKLSDDHTPTFEFLKDALKQIKTKEKFIFCLYSTSILTTVQDLKKSFKLIKKKGAGHLCPVIRIDNNISRSFIKKKGYLSYLQPKFKLERGQDLPELFLDTGSFYIYKASSLFKLSKNNPLPKKSISYLINKNKAVDVNYPKDFKLIKSIFKKIKIK